MSRDDALEVIIELQTEQLKMIRAMASTLTGAVQLPWRIYRQQRQL